MAEVLGVDEPRAGARTARWRPPPPPGAPTGAGAGPARPGPRTSMASARSRRRLLATSDLARQRMGRTRGRRQRSGISVIECRRHRVTAPDERGVRAPRQRPRSTPGRHGAMSTSTRAPTSRRFWATMPTPSSATRPRPSRPSTSPSRARLPRPGLHRQRPQPDRAAQPRARCSTTAGWAAPATSPSSRSTRASSTRPRPASPRTRPTSTR